MKTIIVVICIAFISCQKKTENNLKVMGGNFMKPGDLDTAPAVMKILSTKNGSDRGGSCTSTAVSSNTILTAAHCVTEADKVCITSGELASQKLCSQKFNFDPTYKSKPLFERQDGSLTFENTGKPHYDKDDVNKTRQLEGPTGNDVAFVVFEGNPFKYTFKLSNEALTGKNIPALMVGYSTQDVQRENIIVPESGPKRWGPNFVNYVGKNQPDPDGGASDVDYYHSKADKVKKLVSVTAGDSGGPLFSQSRCEIFGVASGGLMEKGISAHASIVSVDSRSFFSRELSSLGGYICGLSGTDTTKCPNSAIVRKSGEKNPDDSLAFPCVSDPSKYNSNNNIATLFLKHETTGTDASNNILSLKVSAPSSATYVEVCELKAGETECKGASAQFNSLGNPEVSGSKALFLSKPLNLNPSLETKFFFVAKDVNGKAVGKRKVAIRKK